MAESSALTIGTQIAMRCLLVALFLPFSALDKLLNFDQAVTQARQAISNQWLARGLVAGGLCIETVLSAAVLTGVADRLAAVILAGYCVATALLFKQFWDTADFRLRGVSHGRDIFWDFLKNLALAGGFLMLAFGPDAAGANIFFHRPLASTHPYGHVL